MSDNIITLRDYQTAAVAAIKHSFKSGQRRILLALPTGTGKTIVFVDIIAEFSLVGTMLVLVHTDELVRQTVATLQKRLPHLRIGVVKAERNEIDAPIVVASIQTLAQPNRLAQLPARFNLTVADEAHHSVADTWTRVLTHLGVFEPRGSLLLGATATPERGDKQGLSEMFETIVYRRTILEMIEAGWLADLRAIQIKLVGADYNQLHTLGGDFKQGEASRMLLQANAPGAAVAAYQQHAKGRKALVFTPTVEVSLAMAAAFRQSGIRAEHVSGEIPLEERRAILARFKCGETMVVSNCNVLTEGFDEPSVDCIINARPTKSQPLYQQMIGRGTRKHPGKDDCLILDLVGNTTRHDLVTAATLEGLELEPGESAKEGAVRRRIESENVHLAAAAIQEIISREINLFKERRVRWAVAPEGDLFVLSLGTAEGTVQIWKDSDRETGQTTVWDVIRVKGANAGYQRTEILGTESLAHATATAEAIARKTKMSHLYDSEAGWLNKAPSPKMLAVCAQNGIPVMRGETMGKVSDKMSLFFARKSAKMSARYGNGPRRRWAS